MKPEPTARHAMLTSLALGGLLLFGGTLQSALSADGLGAVYVAPNGSDANPGTKSKPVATVMRARDLVRAAKRTRSRRVTVVLRGGTYYLREPVVFTAEDSGTASAPIKYRAARGESVIISGGTRLDLRWTAYKNGIMQAEVPGVKEGRLDFDQLFIDGRRQRMARYPNYDPTAKYFGGTAADAISPERVKRWANPAGGFVHGLHRNEWGGFHYRILGVDERGNLKLKGGWQNNRRSGLHERYRFVENIFEELDAPGEWWLDHAGGVLYFMPPAGVDLERSRVEVAGLKHLFEFRGSMDRPVRFLTIEGLTLTHTARTFMETREPLLRGDWTIYRGGAVLIEGAEDCAIDGCFFDAVGGNAVFVSNYNRRVTVTRCKITEAGANGICFIGSPDAVRSPNFDYSASTPLDRIDRTAGPKSPNYPAQCRADDNLIHSIGRVEKQVAGVDIDMAEEITVSHNSIYDVPRAGINIGDGCWGGHVIEFNDVFDTVKETGDHGSFNSWGRDRYWQPDRGLMNRLCAEHPELVLLDARKTTVIRNNRWRCDHGWDIDLDDGSSHYHIYNNLCLNGGLKLREGFYRTVENNVIVNNSFHPHVWFEHSGDVFVRNVVSSRYFPIGMPKVWGKSIDDNSLPDRAALDQSRKLALDLHSAAGDPLFVNPARGDYRVKPGSPALKLGFKNFRMDNFGVVSPKLRTEARTPALPTRRAPGASPARPDRTRP
ncbi:MAG: right-handed parallel beta-helix repeat-containing protein [Limisphaerales bacterium]